MISTLALLTLGAAPGFAEQVFDARAVVELTVDTTPPPKSKATDEARVLASLKKQRTVARVLSLSEPEAPDTWPAPALTAWKPGCPGDGAELRMLVLYSKDKQGRWRGVPIDQQARGRATDRDAAYNLLVEAVAEARQWSEERMRAVGPGLLWQRERAALRADNPFLRALAVAFLRTHEAADVIDTEWGAPGSASRATEEAKAVLPEPACPRLGG